MQKKERKRTQIVWGVCGIGHGHTFRQLPLIEHFSDKADIEILAYGESYDFFQNKFKDQNNINIERVAVPFYVGNDDGLDFNATAFHPANQNIDFHTINNMALKNVRNRIGKADLVISDYEPMSAQYAYALNIPLVTIDQQSKYLYGEFPQPLHGQYFQDEKERLRLFFPKAQERLACSFFNVEKKSVTSEKVTICSPIFNQAVLNAKDVRLSLSKNNNRKSLIFYISAQQPFGQSLGQITDICANFPEIDFHFFGKGYTENTRPENHVKFYKHGHHRFHDILARCDGIISTAGHTLLSEAMFLNIPVLALPLPLYEQQMNAHVIDKNGFGLLSPIFNQEILTKFLKNLDAYTSNIMGDRIILNKNDGKNALINKITSNIQLKGWK